MLHMCCIFCLQQYSNPGNGFYAGNGAHGAVTSDRFYSAVVVV